MQHDADVHSFQDFRHGGGQAVLLLYRPHCITGGHDCAAITFDKREEVIQILSSPGRPILKNSQAAVPASQEPPRPRAKPQLPGLSVFPASFPQCCCCRCLCCFLWYQWAGYYCCCSNGRFVCYSYTIKRTCCCCCAPAVVPAGCRDDAIEGQGCK